MEIKIRNKNPVLILEGTLNGLVAARYFSKYGIDVYLLTAEKSESALLSRYFKKKYVVPRLWACNDFKRILKGIASVTNKRIVVYAATDLAALFLSKLKDEVRDDYHFVVGNREATEILVDKEKFYHQLEKNHVNYPLTFFPRNVTEVTQIKNKLSYPIFIRPNITQLFFKEFGYPKKGFVAYSPKELVHYYKLATVRNVSVMLQEIIPGPANNSFQLEAYYNKEFRSTGFLARQRLRIWPLDFGNTTLCISVPLSRFVNERQKIDELMENIRYNGLASVEFKMDPRDNKLKLLEINARLWRHFWLSAECGVDILMSSYLDSIGEENENQTKYALGIKSLFLLEDLPSSAKLLLKGELGFKDWVSSLKGKKCLPLLDKKDPLPFIVESSRVIKSNIKFRLKNPLFGLAKS
jgi:D-aspartate ligase